MSSQKTGQQTIGFDVAARCAGWVSVTEKRFAGGARGDGVTDDTAAIVATQAALPSGGQVWFPRGTYRITSALTPSSNTRWVGVPGASIIRNDNTAGGHAISWVGSAGNRLENFWIDGLEIVGNGASGDGVHLEYTVNLGRGKNGIERCVIRSHGGQGIYWTFGDALTVRANEIAYNGEHGIYVYETTNQAIVTDCAIHHNVKTGIYLNQVASNCAVAFNAIHDNGWSGVEAIRAEQPTITYNAFNRNSYSTLPADLGPDANEARTSGRAALYLHGETSKMVAAATVAGNLFGDNDPSGYDVTVLYTHGLVLHGNYFYVTNALKPASVRLLDESHGISAVGNYFYKTTTAAGYGPFSYASGASIGIDARANWYINAKTSVTGAADNGSGLVRITATGHGLATGARVHLVGVAGTTEANGTWTATVIDANTLDLQGSAFANAYTSGGTLFAYAETDSTNRSMWEFSDSRVANLRLNGESNDRWGQRANGDQYFGPGTFDPTLYLRFQDYSGVAYLETNGNFGATRLALADTASAPSTIAGKSILYVDSADSTPKLRSAAGISKTIALGSRTSLTYGTTVTPNCANADEFDITPTDGVGFTVANPTNPRQGQTVAIRVINTTGGALGALTWGANYKASAWTQPAAGNHRVISFRYDGTNWREVSRTPADVPN